MDYFWKIFSILWTSPLEGVKKAFLFNIQSKLFIGYFLFFILISLGIALWGARKKSHNNGIIKEAFPSSVYSWHFLKQDLFLFFTNWFFLVKILFQFSVYSAAFAVTTKIFNFWGYSFANHWPPMIDHVFSSSIISFLFLFVFKDFASFLSHYLSHKVPFLWEFHKIHHSARKLNPITGYRFHFIDAIWFDFFEAVLVMGFLCILSLITKTSITVELFKGLIIVAILANLMEHFRHSFIWISYGRYWSYIFLSPAQHQIHHSIAPEHLNKNLGHYFSFWDFLFGTLFVPKEKTTLELGLVNENGIASDEYTKTNWELIWGPFYLSLAVLFRGEKKKYSAIILVLFFIAQFGAFFVQLPYKTQYFKWAMYQIFYFYEFKVSVNGRELSESDFFHRYKFKKQGAWRAVEHLKRHLQSYEKQYGKNDFVEVQLDYYENNNQNPSIWIWNSK